MLDLQPGSDYLIEVLEQANQIERVWVTDDPAEGIIRTFGIDPARWVGKKVLDIASGGSDLVEFLREQGVLAYGVDLAYRDMPNLLGRVNENRESSEPPMPPVDSLPMLRDPSPYVGANALLLPYPDNTFHRVINSRLIASNAGSFGVFTTAFILEALRVTERRGELLIGVLSGSDNLDDKDKETAAQVHMNITAAFEEVKASKLARNTATLNLPDSSKVFRITKR